MNHLFPSLLEEISSLDRFIILDGELVIEDENGRSYFQSIASGEPVPDSLHLHYQKHIKTCQKDKRSVGFYMGANCQH